MDYAPSTMRISAEDELIIIQQQQAFNDHIVKKGYEGFLVRYFYNRPPGITSCKKAINGTEGFLRLTVSCNTDCEDTASPLPTAGASPKVGKFSALEINQRQLPPEPETPGFVHKKPSSV
ncbi:unnamed protein product [Dibothriocephalus latus]|uniref:Uncharacterized protein n=1 Tax=Dibothriocephalus latus TaxID=60516 RepID=A0A3P7NUC9_DIBLA|nr:unnamed protein product [Dibothriocephalus latus]